MEDKKNDKMSEINTNLNSQIDSTDQIIEELGYISKINGELFNPEEVNVLSGDSMTREITQLIQFLCESYPFEAIDYCLKRCFYKSFSKTSLLDKIIKYLLDKYKKNENSENLIIDLFYAYKDNILLPKISNVNQFNASKDAENKQLTKIVFYDQSKDDVYYKNNQNEIFIEISKCLIKDNNNIFIPLEECEEVEIFLCEKRHLFKRFCKRNNYIYVYDFCKYEKIDKKKKNKKKNNNNLENNDKFEAIFKCEQEGCNAKYKYNFNTNKFIQILPHSEVEHVDKEDAPSYYQENINLLIENPYITDIQIVISDN